ncbi:MAG: glycosyltransferase [Pirellulaceae bacterium]
MNTLTHNQATLKERQIRELDVSHSKIWIMLPAYNEEAGLPSLLEKIFHVMDDRPAEYEVVVVDDASDDETARVACQASFQMPVRLVQHRENQGLAGALRTGFDTVLGLAEPGDVMVTLDADDTQQPGTIERMLLMISEGYDVVIASRYQPGSRVVGVPFNRRVMTWFARLLFRTIIPIPGVRDYTCGFRAYRVDALREASDHYGDSFVSEKGFSAMVDVLLKMRRFNFVMGEVPMLLRYDLKHGPSKMQVSRTARQTIKLLLKRRFEN